ncbi:ABC transporter permease [Clostridium celatum]|uniref:ABC-2 type transporter n=1 Tax=Clostridium celatum DSM 1785 TaxID=545697 RepID=L1QCS1_9CLOT|nr:ABC transporter permease subunit [Clostridium celatum]EKY25773.1 ABC-2 type transporter [Clostridium celatum DSM 1785]MCE9653699.1 ABC transporter permease [Clostridium celatum]MDU2265367.1 ABC transporter permease subunit [Clostridium celatum]MDU6294999.1 ABC transporter permease subunit [Clostridium celatum]MDY3361492.1 ABC transporter permease subunit [Clostridium celatum]
MRLNPVLRNESKLAVRSIKFTLMIFAYIAILSVAAVIYYNSLNSEVFVNGLNLQSSVMFYVVMAIGQAVLLMFIVPSLTSTAICSEREKQTLDILLSSKLTPLQIIVGKVFASSLRVIVLIICTMPLYAICSLIGGVKLSNIIELIIFFIVNTIFVGSIGVFVSTYVKTSKVATALSYGLVLFIYVGIIVIAWAIFIISMMKLSSSGTMISDMPKVSPIVYLSPVAGFASLLINQVGLGAEFNYMLIELGMNQNTEYISIVVQLVLSAIFIYLAAIKLNPLNKNFRKKSKKVKE